MFQPIRRRQVQPKEEGCKMDIKRDSSGRIKGMKTNGKCREEIKMLQESGELPKTNEEKE